MPRGLKYELIFTRERLSKSLSEAKLLPYLFELW